jgi:glycine C-acetyltransferase
VIAGDEAKGQQLAARLFDLGVFATSVVYPTVPLGKARVRTIVTSEHSRDDLQTCLEAFATAGRELRLI